MGSGLRRVTHLRSVRIGVRVPHPKNAGRDGEFHQVERAVAQLLDETPAFPDEIERPG